MISITASLSIPEREIHLTYSRSSGPGGQNVNKVNSKATLRWNVSTSKSLPDALKQRFIQKFSGRLTDKGDLVLSSDASRDQKSNAENCKRRLAAMLRAVMQPPKKRKKTKPTKLAKEKRLQSKKSQAEKKRRRGKVNI